MLESVKQLPRWVTITLALPLVTLNLWVLSWIFEQAQPLVNVLIVANVLAFILDYPVQLLQNRGIQRSYGILLILLIVLSRWAHSPLPWLLICSNNLLN